MSFRSKFPTAISGLLLVALIAALLACEGQTITIEESTETADGSRTVRVSSSSDDGTPEPTATPRPRIDFPPMSDGAALTALFDATDGDGWSSGDGWLYIEDLGQWYGVTTNAEGRVTALDLSAIGLSGELPEDIGVLTELTELDLSDNQLSGAMPAEIGELVNLEELYLNGNQFSGALPASLGNLANLEALHLHDNGFGAEFPAALGNLSNLESVTIWSNKFTWADSYAPGLLADMVGLVALYESAGGENWRERSGWLSDPSVAAWSGVSIGGDGSVSGLDLSENGLSGELPPQLGGLVGLTSLDLSGNQLEGEIPESIGNLTAMEELSMHSNQLGGNLPADIGNLTALTVLTMHSNQFSGNLPAGIGGMADLEELSVHTNRFSGPVPAELGNLGNLEVLWLHDNQLSGELPGELTNVGSLEQLSLFGNNLEWAETYAPGIVADMVGLMALYESAGGENWSNSSNWHTTTPVGEWHGVTSGAGGLVTELTLSGNGLNGDIPPQLGNLLSMTKLHLDSNQLSSEIPESLGNLVSLEELLLNDSQLKGNIPSWITRLSRLSRLHLNNNELSGAIPAQVSNLSGLEELNLANNSLGGPVPPELGNLSRLKLLYLDNNELSGELPTQLGNLTNLKQVSVWDNRLTWADHYENGILADTVALVAIYESALDHSGSVRPGYLLEVSNWLSYEPLRDWAVTNNINEERRIYITVEGGRITELTIGSDYLEGTIPSEIGLLNGLKKLVLMETPDLGGCIASSLRGIEYEGDLPFCTGPTSVKKATGSLLMQG